MAFILLFGTYPAAALELNLTSDGTTQGPPDNQSSNNDVTFGSGSSGSFGYFLYGGRSLNGSGGNIVSGNRLVINAPGVTFGSSPSYPIDPSLSGTIFSALGGYAIGDTSGAGYTVENNSLSINAGTASGLAIGGVFYSSYLGSRSGPAIVRNNTLTLAGDTVVQSEAFAGVAYLFNNDNLTSVTGNVLNVSGNASVITDINTTGPFIGGGFAFQLDGPGNVAVTGNTVNLSENGNLFGSVLGGGAIVQGGSGRASAIGNTVNIYGGTINTAGGFVAGGFASANTAGFNLAEQNTVNLSGGVVTGDIAGGYADNNGYATGNKVNISGGTVLGNVYGGHTGNNGYATGNTVTVSGTPDLTLSRLYGNNNPQGGAAWQSDGNTLVVNGFQGSVQGVANFQNYNFFLPASRANGQTMLTVTDAVDISNTSVNIPGLAGGGTPLAPGDTVTLIHSNTGLTGAPVNTRTSAIKGVSLLYDFDLAVSGDSISASVSSVQFNPRTKALAEGRSAGQAFANQGADLAVGRGIDSALSATGNGQAGLAAFGAVSGGTSRYDTGSHVDVDGFSLMTGLARRTPLPYGSLMAGAFFEAGWGNYDSHNSFSGFASVKGDGDTSYYGGGILGRYDMPMGLYLDASARTGRVKTDFSSSDLQSGAGENATYDTSSWYYGAHAGLGYLWQFDQKASLDISSKYLWTRQEGDSVRVVGDPVRFKDSDSQRWRSGARFSYALTDQFTPYVGAGYEYEFDGKSKATTYSHSIDAPSLKGGTGVGELGVSFSPVVGSGFSLDLGVQGYTGVREGVTGNFLVKYEF